MSNNQCPECGYPDTKDGQHFKGIYMSGMPCPHCQFFQGRVPLEEQLKKVFADKLQTREGVLEMSKYALSWLYGQQATDPTFGRVAQVLEALAQDVSRRTFKRPVVQEAITAEVSQAGPYPTAWANYAMKDLELHVRVRMQNDCVMDYEVREFVPYDDGVGDSHKFEMSTDKLIEGTIKWDGCSHNNFAPNEPSRGYIHGCAREHLVRLGELYRRLFDIAMERMPDNKDYLS